MIKLKTPHNKKMNLVANYRLLSLLVVFSSICAKEIENEVKCVDVADWKDAYNDGCEWYASQPGSCEHFGDCCENKGYTASTACCSCGGGREMDLSDKTLHQKGKKN